MKFCTNCGKQLADYEVRCSCGCFVQNNTVQNYNNYSGEINNKKRSNKKWIWISIAAVAIIVISIIVFFAMSNDSTTDFSKAKVGDIIVFGKYEQDDKLSNGEEDIEWIVLKKEKNRMLVVSKYALDYKKFDVSGQASWRISSLREWLNDDFINEAFTEEQKLYIEEVKLNNDAKYGYGSRYDDETYDEIFLLSISEVEEYFHDEEAMKLESTLYAETVNSGRENLNNWWTRSCGDYSMIFYVSDEGTLHFDGDKHKPLNKNAVRPAMWISFSKQDTSINKYNMN